MHRNVNQLAVAELGFVFMSSAAESKHLPPGLRMCISFSCGSFYSPLHRPQLASILGPSQHKRHFPGEAFPEAVHIPQGCAALSPAMPPSRAACSQLQLCPYPHDDVWCPSPALHWGMTLLSLPQPCIPSFKQSGTGWPLAFVEWGQERIQSNFETQREFPSFLRALETLSSVLC